MVVENSKSDQLGLKNRTREHFYNNGLDENWEPNPEKTHSLGKLESKIYH